MNEAFVTALGTGLKLSAAFAAAGAVVCWLLISPRIRTAEAPAAQQATAAGPAGVEPRGELAPSPDQRDAEPAPSPRERDPEPARSPREREGEPARA